MFRISITCKREILIEADPNGFLFIILNENTVFFRLDYERIWGLIMSGEGCDIDLEVKNCLSRIYNLAMKVSVSDLDFAQSVSDFAAEVQEVFFAVYSGGQRFEDLEERVASSFKEGFQLWKKSTITSCERTAELDPIDQ